MSRALSIVLVGSLSLLACGDDDDVAGDAGDTRAGEALTLSETFEPIEIGVRGEDSNICLSWALGNPEPIWINTVRMEGGPGLHHSNWFYVREDTYPGEHGRWRCTDRGFNSLNAGGSGGVVFAQSTQAVEEAQAFPEGVAIRIPANAVIMGQVHVLNITPEPQRPQITMHLDTIPEAQVETRLNGVAFDYLDLEIKPRMRSEFTMDCDFGVVTRGEIDFSLYYLLPHYHALGEKLRLEVIGGPNDGETVFAVNSGIGEPLGQVFDPPIDLRGATGLRFTCGYDNPTDANVGYGIGDQEMCLALAFIDSRRGYIAGHADFEQNVEVRNEDGVSYNEAPCTVIPYLPR